MPIKVSVYRADQVDKAMKIFKRNCSASGILRDIRSKKHYEKPTTVKRLAKKQRVKNSKEPRSKLRGIEIAKKYA